MVLLVSAHVDLRGSILGRLLRALMVVMIVAAWSGVSALIAGASSDDAAECADRAADGPGDCDPVSCPPGPLCQCAPPAAAAQPSPNLAVVRDVAVGLAFTIETRVPPSVSADGVFHPPRCFA